MAADSRASALLTIVALLAGSGSLTSCGGSEEGRPAQKTTEAIGTQEAGTELSEAAPGEGQHFTIDNWDILAADPEAYEGATAEIVGKVFTAPERDADGVYFQMWADPKNGEFNTIVAYLDPAYRVDQDDFVRVKGTVSGSFEGTNAFGGDVTAVSLLADTVRRVDATAAASPPVNRLGKARFTQADITVAIEKVVLAEDETRVFIAVKNASPYEFSMYSFSARFVVDGRQYESDANFDYPELASDLVPGAFTSGVVVFPAVDPDAAKYALHLEGSSENYEVGDYGTLTWTFTWS